MIFDCDTGGLTEHFVYTVRTLERLGVSAVIIEDKEGLKMNSLFGTDVKQTQASIESFCSKIAHGKKAQVTDDFMIIARIESLILKQNDAITRAKAYIDAGADGILIHSKSNTCDEIRAFAQEYNKFEKRVPLVVVPTTYSSTHESELEEMGVNIVIYANHLLRASYPAMLKTAKTILEKGRAFEAEENIMSIKEILDILPNKCEI